LIRRYRRVAGESKEKQVTRAGIKMGGGEGKGRGGKKTDKTENRGEKGGGNMRKKGRPKGKGSVGGRE